MTLTHYKFPSIESLRHLITSLKHRFQNPQQTTDGWIFDESLELPVLHFNGTVKLHGVNAAIVFDPKLNKIYAQSRELVITPQNDLHGFARFVENNQEKLNEAMEKCSFAKEAWDKKEAVVIYGEWCGRGINHGVAVCQLDKMFVVFDIKIGNRWLHRFELKQFKLEDLRVFNITDFKSIGLDIDFDAIDKGKEAGRNGALGKEGILANLDYMTDKVEKECPVAKKVGDVSGIGEGIVWKCDNSYEGPYMVDYDILDSEGDPWMFKTKGEKHKNTKEPKGTQLTPEKFNSINELVTGLVTPQRLEQGLTKLLEKNLDHSKRNTGEYVKWIVEDIQKENDDVVKASGLDFKDIQGAIQKTAREFYLTKAT